MNAKKNGIVSLRRLRTVVVEEGGERGKEGVVKGGRRGRRRSHDQNPNVVLT
jgi:hypothetical protein